MQDPSGNSAADWIDKYLLFGSTKNFGTVTGNYDSGKANGWQVAGAGAWWFGNTTLLAVSVLDGVAGVKALPALAKGAVKEIPNLAAKTGLITYRDLGVDEVGGKILGETSWLGDITPDTILKGKETTKLATETLAHESVHAVRVGKTLASARLHYIGYLGSKTYRFLEELSAEREATGDLGHSIDFGLTYSRIEDLAREVNLAAHIAAPGAIAAAHH